MKNCVQTKLRTFCGIELKKASPVFYDKKPLILRTEEEYYTPRRKYGELVANFKQQFAGPDFDYYKAAMNFGLIIEQVQVASYLESEDFLTHVDDTLKEPGDETIPDIAILNLSRPVFIDVKAKNDYSEDFIQKAKKTREWYVKPEYDKGEYYIFCHSFEFNGENYTALAGWQSKKNIEKLQTGTKFNSKVIKEDDLKPINELIKELNKLRINA